MIWLQRNCLVKISERFIMFPENDQAEAAIYVGRRLFWVKCNGCADQFYRLFRRAHLECNNTQKMLRPKMKRADLKDFLIACLRFQQASLLVHDSSALKESICLKPAS